MSAGPRCVGPRPAGPRCAGPRCAGPRCAGVFRQSTRQTDSCLKPSRDRLLGDAMISTAAREKLHQHTTDLKDRRFI